MMNVSTTLYVFTDLDLFIPYYLVYNTLKQSIHIYEEGRPQVAAHYLFTIEDSISILKSVCVFSLSLSLLAFDSL